jgi:hypothetical protein
MSIVGNLEIQIPEGGTIGINDLQVGTEIYCLEPLAELPEGVSNNGEAEEISSIERTTAAEDQFGWKLSNDKTAETTGFALTLTPDQLVWCVSDNKYKTASSFVSGDTVYVWLNNIETVTYSAEQQIFNQPITNIKTGGTHNSILAQGVLLKA